MKIILNVAERFIPNKNDILVYNGKNWEVENIANLVAKQDQKIDELSSKCDEMELKFTTLNNKFNKLLDIVKEHIKND